MSQPDDQKNNSTPPQNDLGSELRELGQQIEQTVRSAIESDRARQIQNDISAGLKEIGGQVQSALKAIQEDERLKKLAERGQQAVSQAQQSQTAHDFQEALTRGIAQLNDQLSAFASRLRTSDAPEAPPATGATTRLDDDK